MKKKRKEEGIQDERREKGNRKGNEGREKE